VITQCLSRSVCVTLHPWKGCQCVRINRQELSNVGGFYRPGANSNDNGDDDDYITNSPTCCLSGKALDIQGVPGGIDKTSGECSLC